MKTNCKQQPLKEVLLVGNPNTGKTTLFNLLTGANEHVGNWHGVTVEEKGREFDCLGQKLRLVDLPGIYSMTALSYEEQVAIDYIRAHGRTKIINICDLNNLQRNLSLTLGLLEYGLDVILAVNCMDKKPLNKLDCKKLSSLLNIPVVELNASKGYGVEELKKQLQTPFSLPPKPKHLSKLPLASIKSQITISDASRSDYFAVKLLEKDETVAKEIHAEKVVLPENSISLVAKARYDYIAFLQKQCIASSGRVYGASKLDKVFLNRFLAFPIFLLILCAVFYLTFFSFGAWLSDGLNFLLDSTLGKLISSAMTSAFGESSWLTRLVCDALIGGVGTVLSFLPQVGLLFLFLSLLEDSGYLSRVAFASEDLFGKLGLSGKSFYTLLMGFGCSTTAVLTARNMDDKKAKIKTAMLTPYMSCSAKFPIYVVIGGAFFGASNVFVILGLYLLGLAVSVLLSFIYEKTILKSKQQSFILEFPPYRWGGVKRLASVLFENIKTFLVRVGSLLISMNVIVWLLSNFSFTFSYIPESGGASMLESLGVILAPLFAPLGFGTWGAASALLAGVIAKEVVISSIAMFNFASTESQIAASLTNPESMVFFASPSAALSFLVFCLLYCPCISTTAVLGKEIGKKWTAFAVVSQFIVAYIVTLFIYNVARAVESFGLWPVLGILAGLLLIAGCIFKLISTIKKPRACRGCKGCK